MEANRHIEAVLIDVDDTLVLTEAAAYEIENLAIQKQGLPKFTRELHKQTWGQPLFEIILRRSPGVDIDSFRKTYKELVADYVKNGKVDKIEDWNIEILKNLRRLGLKLFIVTSRELQEVEHMLAEDHILANYIDAFYHKDNNEYHKPDPRVFNKVLFENNMKSINCIYVGDSVSDAEAAFGAGMGFVACLEAGLRKKEDFSHYPSTLYINKFTELYGLLKPFVKYSEGNV